MLARIFFSALNAFTVYNDTGAGTVRAEDPVFQTVGVTIVHWLLGLEVQRRAAFHTETTCGWYDGIALGTSFTGDLFVAMGTFHNHSQLFEEVTV
jgi:hypothetical protein